MGHQNLYGFFPYVINFSFSIQGILLFIVIGIGLVLCLPWREKSRIRLRIILLSIFSFIIFIYVFFPYVFNFPLGPTGLLFFNVIAIGLLLCLAWREKPRTRLRIILLSIFSFIIFCFAVCVFFLTALGMGGL